MDQTLHRVTTKEGEEIKGTTKQKRARRHSKTGRKHLEQENTRQKTIEGTDGGLHSAVDGQSPSVTCEVWMPKMKSFPPSSSIRVNAFTLSIIILY